MRLAAIVLEEHARRAMELRDDHALGAVDDERAVFGHERDFAHVDLLLLHLLHRIFRCFTIHDDQPNARAKRRAVRQPALLAFDNVECRRQQRIRDKLESGIARMARDRKDRRERSLQAFILACVAGRVGLKERAIRHELRFEQEGDRQNARALREALADAFFLGERVRGQSHAISGFA